MPWNEEFRLETVGRDWDFVSQDGRTIVEVQQHLHSQRAFVATVAQLALALAEQPAIERGILVVQRGRLSLERLQLEWKRLRQLFPEGVTRRLGIIVLQPGPAWVDSDDPYLRHVAALYARRFVHEEPPGAQTRSAKSVGEKYVEAVKILLVRWLLKTGPIQIGELAREVGCSYPTIRGILDQLTTEELIDRTSKRAVAISRFPPNLKARLLSRRSDLQPSQRYVDATGESPDYQKLAARLDRLHPPGCAYGGVIAAQHWYPEMDLNGIPQIHLVVHSRSSSSNLLFLKKWDPALQAVNSRKTPAAVVIHRLNRAESLFASSSDRQLKIADPIEAWLDLAEAGLTVQADQMLVYLSA